MAQDDNNNNNAVTQHPNLPLNINALDDKDKDKALSAVPVLDGNGSDEQDPSFPSLEVVSFSLLHILLHHVLRPLNLHARARVRDLSQSCF